jgi:hypothetical protein
VIYGAPEVMHLVIDPTELLPGNRTGL